MLAMLCLVVLGGSAAGDDFYPPDFRGLPLSVEAEWDFMSPPANWYDIPPDYFNAIGGYNRETLYDGFSTHLEVTTPSFGTWMQDPFEFARQDGGITPGQNGDYLTLSMQNWVDQMPYKDVRIQITSWWLNPIGAQPVFDQIDVAGNPLWDWEITGGGYMPVGQGLNDSKDYTWIDLRLWPNPDWEKITFFVPAGLVIDQIRIDTVSIPEPLTLALLGVGGLLALRKRS